VHVHGVRAALPKQLTAVTLEIDGRVPRASRGELEVFPDDRCVGERLLAEGAIGLENERYRLVKVRARLLERGALRVRARKLLDKGDEAFRYLLEDGRQFERHEEILTLLPPPAPNDTEFSGERKRVRCNELLAGVLGWLGSANATKEALDAKVFVDFGPMNALAVTQELPVRALLWGGGEEAWKPDQWRRNSAAVGKADDEFGCGDLHRTGQRSTTSVP
jgi:hypothetical protein